MLERVSMSCNGCRILRKGCNDNCILRQSLQSIENPQSQANATVFVAKFFGRAGLISFLSSVPQSRRPALFQSLLFEACGRTVNPVSGAVGLLSTGNWHLCQSAVETVLAGGVPRCLPEFSATPESSPEIDGGGLEDNNNGLYDCSRDLNMRVNNGVTAARMTSRGREKRRADSPPSDESETTTLESGFICHQDLQQRKHHGNRETKLLRLFM